MLLSRSFGTFPAVLPPERHSLKQAPEFILRAVSCGELCGGFQGSVLVADICGFTSRFQGMADLGAEGAERISREVSATLSGVVLACSAQGGCPVSFAGDAVTVLFPSGPEAAGAACESIARLASCDSLPLKTSVGSGTILWDVIPMDEWTFFSFQGSALSAAAGGPFSSADTGTAVFSRSSGVAPLLVFLPPDLFGTAAVNEFRQVASIFVSLENRSGSSCPRAFQELVLRMAGELGGFVSGMEAGAEGHRMLVVFGAPVTREDDPLRADAFLSRVFAGASGRVRAGAATGLVFSGTVNTPLLSAYTVLGPSVNLAARLHDAASWNSVFGDTAFNAASRLGIRRERELSLKGFPSDVRTLVLSPWKHRVESREAAPPLIERDGVLEEIGTLLSERGSSVLLLGDTGMGKTRLSEEYHSRCGNAFVMNLRCRSLPAAGADIFASWFGEWLGEQGRQEGLPAFKEKLYGFIDRLEELPEPSAGEIADELLRAESVLAALVGLDWERSLYQGLDPQGRFANTVAVIAAFVRGRSLLGRAILVIDDLQWIDPDSMKLLESVLAELGDDRPPVLMLSRPDSPPVPVVPGLLPVRMDLQPLSREGCRSFLKWSLGRLPSEQLLEWFHVRTEGIPFFMEQYAGMLESAEAPPDEERFPGTLHAILVARLDRLAPGLRRAVLGASILGREFDGEVLHCLLPDENPEGLLEKGIRERIWRRSSDGGYSFVHILLREAAYRLQLSTERVALHSLAADAMAGLLGAKAEKAGMIAHQMESAGRYPEASRWYMKAGEHSLSRRMNTAFLLQMEKVLELSSESPLRLGAYRMVFDLHVSQGDLEKAEETLKRVASDPDLDARSMATLSLMRANLFISMGRPREAMDHLEGIEEADPSLRPEVMHLMGRVLVLEGRAEDARDMLLSVYSEFRSGSPGERLLAHKALGNGCGCMIRLQSGLEEAEKGLTQVLEYARETGNLLMETLCVGNLALVYKYLPARLEDAMNMTRLHIDLARRTGSRLVELQALGNLGALMERVEPSGEALRLLKEAVELARKHGGADTVTISMANLASAYGRVHRYEEAVALFQEILRICEQEGLGLHRPDYAVELAHVYMDIGRVGDAEKLMRQVLEWDVADDYFVYISCARGRLLTLLGRKAEAGSILRDALAVADAQLERFDLLRQLYLTAGDPDVFRECLETGEHLQEALPHWDMAVKLDDLRALAPAARAESGE